MGKIAKMNILTIPNKLLTTHGDDVTDFTEAQTLAERMIDTAKENNLAGLAANQVGILSRIFVMDLNANADGLESPHDFIVFINPKTKVDQSAGQSAMFEGCASIPNKVGLVMRWNKLTITAQNIQGEIFSMNLSSYLARIAQHENDHLNGVLFLSKARQIRKI